MRAYKVAGRLFILDRTPLKKINNLDPHPKSGDVIVFLRASQACNDNEIESLREENIFSVWGETLLDIESSRRTDSLGSEFVNTWYWENGVDLSYDGALSFGRLVDSEISFLTVPKYMIRTGEIIRSALRLCPNAKEVFSDLTDGVGLDIVSPSFRPLHRLCKQISIQFGRKFLRIDPCQKVPPIVVRKGFLPTWTKICLRLLGGFRLQWLWARFSRLFFLNLKSKIIYAQAGRGTELIIKHLVKIKELTVFVNRVDLPGAYGLRHDHLFVLPKFRDIKQAKRVIKRARALASEEKYAEFCSFKGINYGPILAEAVASVLSRSIWKNVFVLAQFRKLQEVLKFSALLTNGETGFTTAAIVDLNAKTNVKTFYVGHGIDVHKFSTLGMAHNSTHVTYFAAGEDHKDEFGVHLPKNLAPRKLVFGNPLTVLMDSVRGCVPKNHRKRILVLGCGFPGEATATRTRSSERFLIDVFKLGRELARDSWTLSYRAHPDYPGDLERYIAAELGMLDAIKWDNKVEFVQALLSHDVVITAFSSVYYQSLYAGWPTIYYDPVFQEGNTTEPIFQEELFVGLPRARDICWPVAHDRKSLKKLILETIDGDSFTSSFPKKFVGELSPRFIGPDPEHSHILIANFISKDIGLSAVTSEHF